LVSDCYIGILFQPCWMEDDRITISHIYQSANTIIYITSQTDDVLSSTPRAKQ
jgi:hypothetical protein